MPPEISALKIMVRGAYDLQQIRIQTGLRLCANFNSKLTDVLNEDTGEEEMGERAQSIIKLLKESYTRMTDGVARNRTLPDQAGFKGDELISTYSELVLIDQYLRIEGAEAKNFRQFEQLLLNIPIYTHWLQHQRGVGPAMAAVLITSLDPHKARNISGFWRYAGMDVAEDGYGRSRRAEHLIDHEYTDKEGNLKTRKGVTFNPFLRTKLLGVLATSFLRTASPWREVYDGYKHRLQTSPAREKVTVGVWKERRKAGEDMRHVWVPGRIHNASMRYMVKQFLAQLWLKWRELEGLPVTDPYSVAVQGARPHGMDSPRAASNPHSVSEPRRPRNPAANSAPEAPSNP
jgi:hypothetical protein